MSKQLRSQIDIDATPERVWQVLSDFGSYPQWNPFIVRAEGEAEPGSRLVMRMQPVGARGVTLRPTVVEATPGHRLRWRGRSASGDLRRRAPFTITPRAEGGVRLSQDEHFTRRAGAAVRPLAGPPHPARLRGDERRAQAPGRAARPRTAWVSR